MKPGTRPWFLAYVVLGAASGALVIHQLAPVMKGVSDLGRFVVFAIGILISATFTVVVGGMLERLWGGRRDRE